jgi:hypothetical protein
MLNTRSTSVFCNIVRVVSSLFIQGVRMCDLYDPGNLNVLN